MPDRPVIKIIAYIHIVCNCWDATAFAEQKMNLKLFVGVIGCLMAGEKKDKNRHICVWAMIYVMLSS